VPSLGLDNGGEPGEAAAALAVRHHLICHQSLMSSLPNYIRDLSKKLI